MQRPERAAPAASEKGCEARGLDFRGTTRNTDPATYDPVTAGYMGFGDQSGSKRSTAKTYLADAAARGADFLVHCRVERILVENGRAAGVEADLPRSRRAHRRGHGAGADRRRRLRLDRVAGAACCAAGSAARPSATTCACTRRASSSATTRSRRTRGGVRRRPRLSHEFEDLDDGYGFLIECAQHTTGLTAAALPWRSGRDHKEGMAKYPRGAGFINLTRDRGHGRVTVDAGGRPVLHYPLRDELDVAHLHRGHRRDGADHGGRAASRRCRR